MAMRMSPTSVWRRGESPSAERPPPLPAPAPVPGTHIDLLPQEPLPQPAQQRRLVQLRLCRQVPGRLGRRATLPQRHHAGPLPAPAPPPGCPPFPARPRSTPAPPRDRPPGRGRRLNAGRCRGPAGNGRRGWCGPAWGRGRGGGPG